MTLRSLDTAGRTAGPARGVSLPASAPALVGRDREVGVLLHSVLNPPSLALVEGETGVGKTRLVEEVLAERAVAGKCVALGRCSALADPFPLGPVVQAMRALRPVATSGAILGALQPVLPELSDRLPPYPGPLGDARAERHRLLRAVRELLRATGPVVLVLEDVHWADGATLELLEMLRSDPLPHLATVLTYRPEASAPVPLGSLLRPVAGVISAHVSLSPLGREDVSTFAAGFLGVRAVDPSLTAFLHDRTGGIPFALEELLRLLVERGIVSRDGHPVEPLEQVPSQIPKAVLSVTLERLAGLAPDARRILRVAAVLGVETTQEMLTRCSGLAVARATAALARACESMILAETDGGYRFRHSLARDAIYAAMPSAERRKTHAAAAAALEAFGSPALVSIAEHHRAAGAGRAWIRAATEAAEAAAASADFATAADLLAAVAEHPSLKPRRRAEILARLAHGMMMSSDFSYASSPRYRAALRQCEELVSDERLSRVERGTLRVWWGRLIGHAGDIAGSFAQFRIAVTELRARPRVAVSAMRGLGYPWSFETTIDEHLSWQMRAERQAAGTDNRVLQIALAHERVTLLAAAGDPRALRALEDVPTEPAHPTETAEVARGLANVAQALLLNGHTAPARAMLERVQELTPDIGPRVASVIASQVAFASWLEGSWSGLAESAEALAEANRSTPYGATYAKLTAGLLALATGSNDAAARLRALSDDAWRVQSPPVVALTAAALARLSLAEGDVAYAVQVGEAAVAVARRKRMWTWCADAVPPTVRALIANGRLPGALALVEEFSAEIAGLESPLARARLASARGYTEAAAGRWHESAREHQAAAMALGEMRMPYHAALAFADHADALASGGRTADARSVLEEVLPALDALGASWDAARVRRRLRELGVRVGAAGRRGAARRDLTARETDVVRLLADGKSVRAIGEALFLSHRTVEGHIARAMAKLGVNSRVALVAWFLRERA